MLARLRKSAENKDSGFTLIELLVVMIIIGILAAIAIPAFLSQKKKAKETSAKADATNISKEIAAAAVDGELTGASIAVDGAAPKYIVTATTALGSDVLPVRVSAGNTPEVLFVAATTGPPASSASYCVTVTPDGGSAWSAGPAGLVKSPSC